MPQRRTSLTRAADFRLVCKDVLTGTLASVLTGALLLAGGACGELTVVYVPRDAAANEPASALDAGADANTAMLPAPPPGWTPFTDDALPCTFYVPSDARFLPPPIRWTSCDDLENGHGLPGPDGMACHHMLFDWPASEYGQHTTGEVSAGVDDGGRVTMLFRRIQEPWLYDLVAEADGPVRQAVLTAQPECTLRGSSYRDGHALYVLPDPGNHVDGHVTRVFGGAIDELRPRVYATTGRPMPAGLPPSYQAGAGRFVESGATTNVYAFATGDLASVIDRTPENGTLYHSGYVLHDHAVFCQARSTDEALVEVWTPFGKTQTLAGESGNRAFGATSFGTDGIDMVWVEAHGRTDATLSRYVSYDAWTATYSTDPDAVARNKRRLTREDSGTGDLGQAYVVGCGYAAIVNDLRTAWGLSAAIHVISLSDGVSWLLASESEEQNRELSLGVPIAITCDELFLTGGRSMHAEVLRIGLDSLGTGTPAVPAE